MATKTAARSPGTPATRTRARASALAFIPSGEAIALFKGIELGAQAAKHLAAWLQSEGPLVVQVLEAGAQAGDYRVRLRLTNQTVHGMVLLGAALEWPSAIDPLPLQRSTEPELSFGAQRGLEPVRLPLLLRSAAQVDLHLGFALPSREQMDAGLWHRRVGKLVLRHHGLDQAKPASKAVDFAILLPD